MALVSDGIDWLDRAASVTQEAEESLEPSACATCFRIGDACLEVISNHEPLSSELLALYGDCRVTECQPSLPRISCRVSCLGDSSLLLLAFDGADGADPFETAYAPIRLMRHMQRYAEVPSPLPGWRVLVNVTASKRLLLASDGRSVLINLAEAPPGFAVDCVVGTVQRTQTGVLFLHAACVGISGSGVLLLAPSRSGKTTTALALAARGHRLLGDDLAPVRLATREVIPLLKAATFRIGPLPAALEGLKDRLQPDRYTVGAAIDSAQILVRLGEIIPLIGGGPLPLRFAFLIDGFANQSASEPFEPALSEIKKLRSIIGETTLPWGISPGRDLINFLKIVNLLSKLRCYTLKLQLGSPDQSAIFIERMVVGTCS